VVDTVEIPLLGDRELTRVRASGRDHVAFDELGNAVWQFAPHEDSDPDSPVPRIHPGLAIVEDDLPASPTVRTNVNGLRTGYNPYDSGELGRKAARRPRDLRELSKWIELRKKLAGGK
jgi:hypothetical protein